MGALENWLWRKIDPDVAESIRDEYFLLTARQVQVRARLLFAALFATTPTAWLAASPGASLATRLGAPLAMALICAIGFINLSRDLRINQNVRRARRILREATLGSGLTAMMCSSWCIYSWLGAAPGDRIYYPLIIALGAFSTAYCLSAMRFAARANILINLVPMVLLLMTSGSRLDFAAAVSLVMTGAFQLHMIGEHQRDIVRLLSLQHQSRELARTDPLTGLLNRRALLDHAKALGADGPLRLMLIDIDHFKAINDGFGHDKGDEVLIEVASRLACSTELRASVARVGGEEFAILGRCDELPESFALALLNDVRTARMPHGRQVTISLGMAEGTITGEADWRALNTAADAALYRAKAQGRNCIAQAKVDSAAGPGKAASAVA